MSNIWMVRAGRNAKYLDLFLDESCMTIGVHSVTGTDVLTMDRQALVARTRAANSSWSKRKAITQGGQLYRFLQEVAEGDEVATYDPAQRRYLLGIVTGSGTCNPDGRYARIVTWSQRAPRDVLSIETRNTLGAIQTIFRLSDSASEELRKVAVALDAPEATVSEKSRATPEVSETSVEELAEENLEKSREFIEDMIAGLDPYEMQDLVAGILRALGYKTQVSSKGADRGVDIFASPDGLGLEEPRIFVEVKHRPNSTMGSQEVRSFMGGRQPGDRCLFVSTGGFSKEARYEAERSNVPLTLLGLPQLRELLLEHYEQVDAETKRLVPLVRMYWPASND